MFAFSDKKRRLYANGEQLALIEYYQDVPDRAMLLSSFHVTGLSVFSDYQEIAIIDSPHFSVPVSETVSIDIASYGPYKFETGAAAQEIERSIGPAFNLSIDELLKIVYQKIDSREDPE
jgi:hypothetical protein